MTDIPMLHAVMHQEWETNLPTTGWGDFIQHLVTTPELGPYEYYFEEFTRDHTELYYLPEDIAPEEYRTYVLEQFIYWFTEQMNQYEAASAAAGAGAEQREEQLGAEQLPPDQHEDGSADPFALLDALHVFASHPEDADDLTQDHIELLEEHGVEVHMDLDTLPPETANA
ncbi:hypothetical protein [Streptomyces sp. NPDC048636]|uniref:hypothetical protein n=1 Tax=Streptomyces sp. NPDC048636 TaxID=3155762 RepID=UPI003424A322